ncbi:MAG: tetratricopeptide repeat protein [Crocinitomix sp.]|nr:tetratricopeptide repeat protein [Crocinitomix sp.]
MKQIVLILSLVLISAAGFGQTGKTVNAALAYNDFEANLAKDQEQAIKDIKDAKEIIDRVPVQESSKEEAKRLMYVGKINFGVLIAYGMDSTMFAGLDVEKITEAIFPALIKSKEVDVKERYTDQVDEFANYWRAMMANQGITAYGEQKYEMAMAGLLGAAKFGEVVGVKDSMYYFFGGQAALMEEEHEAAEKAFKECIALNYNTGESVGFLSEAMKAQGKMAEAEKELADAVAKYPDNLDLLIRSINFYIDQGKNEEAGKALSAAIKLAPDNTALLYTSGIIYEKMGRMEDAEAAYNKTLALEPDHTNAKYSLGVFFFNKGADANNEANTFDFNDPKYNEMYDAKIAESKESFKKAVSFLENAEKEEPCDIQILEALKSAYGKAGMVDEFKATKAKIAECENGTEINGKSIRIGMTESNVISLLGEPESDNETIVEGSKSKQMVYSNNVYIYIVNGVVSAIQK